MKNKNHLSWQIGAAYIGTVIGAGFASGQEIMYFFTPYGSLGLITLFLSGLFFMFTGYAIFFTSSHFRAYNYNDYIHKICGSRLAVIYDIIISLFLFLGTSIMFSGSGAVFKENFMLPHIVGVLIIALLTIIVVLRSVKGILSINSVIVPVLIGTIVLIFCFNINNENINKLFVNLSAMKPDNLFRPVFAFMFYCSYNVVLSLGVLSAFAENIRDVKVLRNGAFIGGLGLMVLSLSLNFCLLTRVPHVFKLSIPILYIIKSYHPLIKLAVAVCIWCAVFSTAISNAFSLANRISRNRPALYKVIAAVVVTACIPLSFIDFKKLVALFYPLYGALSMFLIFQILYSFGSQIHKLGKKY